MEENKKEYRKPVMEVLEIEHDNTILTSAGGRNPAHCGKKNKNPALCTSKNPGLCNLGFNPGHGCSNTGNPGNESYGGIYKNLMKC